MTTTAQYLLSNDSFDGDRFKALDLSEKNLTGKDMVNCTFSGLKLQGSQWGNSRLEDCVFEDCDLTRINPAKLRLRGVEFRRCKLLGVDWSDLGERPEVSFLECNMGYCLFLSVSIPNTRFIQCALTEAAFEESDLSASEFSACKLMGAKFERCDLERVSFLGSTDLMLNPAANRVRGAQIPIEAAIAIATSFGLRVR